MKKVDQQALLIMAHLHAPPPTLFHPGFHGPSLSAKMPETLASY